MSRWTLRLGLVACALIAPLAQAASLPPRLEQLRQKAVEHERRGQWPDALAAYDQVLRADRTLADIRERYLICLRHAQQARRHRDPSLKNLVARPLPEALDAYEEVLAKLQSQFVEKDRLRLSVLFQNGLRELRYALEDDLFLQEYLPGVASDKVRAYAAQLESWPGRELPRRRDAREQARAVAWSGLEDLGLNPAVVVVELACGACNSLDEYSAYLTPAQLQHLQASLRGEQVGVGIEVAPLEQRWLVSSVAPGSPAAERMFKAGDRIVRIDGQPVDGLTFEAVMARLLGKPMSPVEIEIIPTGEMLTQTIRLVRQHVFMPSVERSMTAPDGIGYVRILSFQETTVQELKDAILSLQTAGMKVLMLDLRGNPGGLFKGAVQTAELFLSDGVIVSTESPLKRFRSTHRSQNPHALTLPVVLLIDGETASAAEVLAGALKENGRATLVGSTTFGKCCLQTVLPLDAAPSGLKLTVMKFFSPTNQSYSGRGITPHVTIEPDAMDPQRTAVLHQARQVALMLR